MHARKKYAGPGHEASHPHAPHPPAHHTLLVTRAHIDCRRIYGLSSDGNAAINHYQRPLRTYHIDGQKTQTEDRTEQREHRTRTRRQERQTNTKTGTEMPAHLALLSWPQELK